MRAAVKAHNGTEWVEIGTIVTCKGYDVASGTRCYLWDALVPVLAGCVHEHVGELLLCGGHIDDLDSGRMQCGDCSEAGCGCALVRIGDSHL